MVSYEVIFPKRNVLISEKSAASGASEVPSQQHQALKNMGFLSLLTAAPGSHRALTCPLKSLSKSDMIYILILTLRIFLYYIYFEVCLQLDCKLHEGRNLCCFSHRCCFEHFKG